MLRRWEGSLGRGVLDRHGKRPDHTGMPGRTNGEKVRKNRMTRDEVKVILKALFNITDELSIEVVWEHMLEVWKKADGEC